MCPGKGNLYSRNTGGIVSSEIIKSADDCDLVAMGKMGAHAEWRDVFLGTNVEYVIRQTHKPVLITPSEYKPFRKMLIAYDGSSFADKALRSGAEIAQAMKLPITVVCVADKKTKPCKRCQRQRHFLKTINLPSISLQKGKATMQAVFWKYAMTRIANLMYSSWVPMAIPGFRR